MWPSVVEHQVISPRQQRDHLPDEQSRQDKGANSSSLRRRRRIRVRLTPLRRQIPRKKEESLISHLSCKPRRLRRVIVTLCGTGNRRLPEPLNKLKSASQAPTQSLLKHLLSERNPGVAEVISRTQPRLPEPISHHRDLVMTRDRVKAIDRLLEGP